MITVLQSSDRPGQESDITAPAPGCEKLIDLRAEVAEDGGRTVFFVSFTNLKPFRIYVDLNEMAPILNELRFATNAMIARQRRMTLDRGGSKLLELLDTASRPAPIQVIFDPRTGDRVLIVQVPDHAPTAYRLSGADVHLLVGNLEEAKVKGQN
jgi:hypothetical protein